MLSHCCDLFYKYKRVTHVIFDLDGTLIDSEGVYAEALKKTIEYYGKTYTQNISTLTTGCVQNDVAEKVITLLDLETTTEDFVDRFVNYAFEYLDDLELMPGAEKFVRHLATNKIPMAIATSSNEDAVDKKIAKYKELFDLFSHKVCGGTDPEVKAGKPAPDIFLICASRFSDKPDPSNCLVFEDSSNGVRAAIAAGMQVVMIPDKHVPYEVWKLATLRLDSFEYMMPQLFGLPPFPPPLIDLEALGADAVSEDTLKLTFKDEEMKKGSTSEPTNEEIKRGSAPPPPESHSAPPPKSNAAPPPKSNSAPRPKSNSAPPPEPDAGSDDGSDADPFPVT